MALARRRSSRVLAAGEGSVGAPAGVGVSHSLGGRPGSSAATTAREGVAPSVARSTTLGVWSESKHTTAVKKGVRERARRPSESEWYAGAMCCAHRPQPPCGRAWHQPRPSAPWGWNRRATASEPSS